MVEAQTGDLMIIMKFYIALITIMQKTQTVEDGNFGTSQVWELFFLDTPILKNVLPNSLIRVQTTLQHTGNL